MTAGKTCGSACSTPAGTATCLKGYWCNAADENTGAIHKYPCPPGYKAKAVPGFTSLADTCEKCTAGKYCDGADHAETQCPAGYFCPAGTKFATQFPCPPGKKSAAGATSVAGCVACDAGDFCPLGTGIKRACPPGSSCDSLQLDRYSDLCPTGKYFNSGSCVACPADHYCPPGVAFPLKCPSGTKGANNAAGNRDRIEDCAPCSGELCPTYGQAGAQTGYALEAGSGYYQTKNTEFKN